MSNYYHVNTIINNYALIVALLILLFLKLLLNIMAWLIDLDLKYQVNLFILMIIDGVAVVTMVVPFTYIMYLTQVPDNMSTGFRMSQWFWCAYVVTSLLISVQARKQVVEWRETHITNDSIQQALDEMPMGIVVYTKIGVITHANPAMTALSHRLTGGALLNGVEFEKALIAHTTFLEKDESGKVSRRILTFPEGDTWSVARSLTAFDCIQLTATNITEYISLNKQLEAENAHLEIMNQRMRRYGEEMEELIRQEELLNTQIRVHDELGHLLLSTRVYLNKEEYARELLSDDASNQEALNRIMLEEAQLITEWEKQLTSMVHYQVGPHEQEELEDIKKAAKTLGLEVEVHGAYTEDPTSRHLLAAGTRECLTNAFRAGAKKLLVHMTYPEPNHLVITYTNDGEKPDGPIKEGVGLGTLRQIVEREGAKMTITTEDGFCLKLELKISDV